MCIFKSEEGGEFLTESVSQFFDKVVRRTTPDQGAMYLCGISGKKKIMHILPN